MSLYLYIVHVLFNRFRTNILVSLYLYIVHMLFNHFRTNILVSLYLYIVYMLFNHFRTNILVSLSLYIVHVLFNLFRTNIVSTKMWLEHFHKKSTLVISTFIAVLGLSYKAMVFPQKEQ